MATNNLSFPIGIKGFQSQPYMILTSYESKNAIASAEGDPMSSIVLYIPPNSLKQTSLDFFYLIEQKDHNCVSH